MKKATKSGREALVKSFLIALAVFLGLAALDLTGNASFFWTHTYYFLIFFLAIAGFVIVVLHALDIKARLPEKHSLRDFYYLFFIPIGLLPFLECPYKVPFLFCRVCPRRCPWGETRALLFPTMIVQNLDNRHWCFNFCPLGRFQDLQSAVVKKRMRVPLFIVKHRNAIRYALLLGAAALVIKSYYGTAGWFFNGSTAFATGILLVVFTLSFFIPRLWCNYICPIGTLSDAVGKIKCCGHDAKKKK